jgi:hypothetical protein
VSAWDATHIVVATAGVKIDGSLWIVESWKGDLRPGDHVSIASLTSFATPEAREILSWKKDDYETEDRPRHGTGARMILFLKDGSAGVGLAPEKRTWETAFPEWGSYSDRIIDCVGWVEHGEVYSFADHDGVRSIGPGLWHRATEEIVKSSALHATDLRAKFDAGLKAFEAGKTGAEKARALEPLLVADMDQARRAARKMIVTLGDDALPAYQRITDDDSLVALHQDALFAIEETGGKLYPRVLIAYVERQFKFFKQVAPRLERNWRNTDEFRDRSFGLSTSLSILAKLKLPETKKLAREFRAFYLMLPRPSEYDSIGDSLGESFDALVKATE